jgi:hypothetical protein
MTLADDSIKASTFDESTAFPVKSADAGLTKMARTGADGDTLKTLSDQIDAVQSITVTQTTVGAAPVVNIERRQYEAFGSVAFTVTAAQTGDKHSFVIFDPAAPTVAIARFTTDAGQIVVGGAGDKTITVTADDTYMKTARDLNYVLFNTTHDESLVTGGILVTPNPDSS